MDELLIEGSVVTPHVKYNVDDSKLLIEGRCYPEDAENFFQPMLAWIDNLENAKEQKVDIDIRLEYLNTAATKVLVNVLHRLELKCKDKSCRLNVNWYYEQNDEDIQETGEVFSHILNIPFSFKIISEV